MKIVLITNVRYLPDLSPLLKVWAQKGFVVKQDLYEGNEPPAEKQLVALAQDADAIMMLVPAKRVSSTLVGGPVIHVNGKKIPVGLVPVDNLVTLRRFVKTTVEVHQRETTEMAIALLAQRQPRYLKVTGKIFNELTNEPEKREIYKWTSDIVFAGDMLYGINQGLSLCMYVGHGRSMGWAGYYGIRSHHIKKYRNKPAAAILSLCCWTAARRNVKYSFCETLLMDGMTAAGFGALKPTLFTDNTRWAINLSAALQKGVSSVGELIASACPSQRAIKDYRLFGDPTAPLSADKLFFEAAKQIRTYE